MKKLTLIALLFAPVALACLDATLVRNQGMNGKYGQAVRDVDGFAFAKVWWQGSPAGVNVTTSYVSNGMPVTLHSRNYYNTRSAGGEIKVPRCTPGVTSISAKISLLAWPGDIPTEATVETYPVGP